MPTAGGRGPSPVQASQEQGVCACCWAESLAGGCEHWRAPQATLGWAPEDTSSDLVLCCVVCVAEEEANWGAWVFTLRASSQGRPSGEAGGAVWWFAK